jgi:hypothetical protein
MARMVRVGASSLQVFVLSSHFYSAEVECNRQWHWHDPRRNGQKLGACIHRLRSRRLSLIELKKGTLAKSGTAEFLAQAEGNLEGMTNSNLIGAFGLGFYSRCALRIFHISAILIYIFPVFWSPIRSTSLLSPLKLLKIPIPSNISLALPVTIMISQPTLTLGAKLWNEVQR